MIRERWDPWRMGPHDACRIEGRHRHGHQAAWTPVVEIPDAECDRCGGTLDFMGDPCTCLTTGSRQIRRDHSA